MRRIYHHWEKWECVGARMYESLPPTPMTPDEAKQEYAVFLRDTRRFDSALLRVLSEWPVSCEQFLSNENMNRIAWLGQAAMCIETGVPACFRAGFKLLSESERLAANAVADKCLQRWLRRHEGKQLCLAMELGRGLQST